MSAVAVVPSATQLPVRMPLVGRFFILAHAVDRFRERITGAAHLDHEAARALLATVLDQDGLVTRPVRDEPGVFLVYVASPVRLRAVVDTRGLTAERPLPRVVTVRHYKAPPRERVSARRQSPDCYWQRRKRAICAVLWEYSGARTLAWMADEVGRRTGKPISLKTLDRYRYTTSAAPTAQQGWLRASAVAALMGVSPQMVTAWCRAGILAAHRNPGGKWWLVSERAVRAYVAAHPAVAPESRALRLGEMAALRAARQTRRRAIEAGWERERVAQEDAHRERERARRERQAQRVQARWVYDDARTQEARAHAAWQRARARRVTAGRALRDGVAGHVESYQVEQQQS